MGALKYLIKSGRGNRPCEARQPARFAKRAQVLNPTEEILEDEEIPGECNPLFLNEGFFIDIEGIYNIVSARVT